MTATPALTLHVIPGSHPCRTAEAALDHKGLEYERVVLMPGPHVEVMEGLYGSGRTTVPGLMVGDQPVHGSPAVLAKLDEIEPLPPLYPEPKADAIREAERWADEELQDLGRWFTWGAFHFRPERAATFAGGPVSDPEATDFWIRMIRGGWRYHELSAVKIAEALAGLPTKLDRIDDLIAAGVIGGEGPNAADLQIGATLRILLNLGDVAPMIEGRPAETVARRWFEHYDGWIPAGAFPAAWIPD
jgi:glutathione S-transferase